MSRSGSNGGRRVVVADDHPLFRAAVCQLIRAAGAYEIVGEARDGLETLEQCEELRPDLAVIDISMPGADGLTVTRKLNASTHGPKVLVLTAHANVMLALRCFRAGAQGFSSKTAGAAEIATALHMVARGRRYVPPDMIQEVTAHLLDHTGDVDPMDSLTARELEILRLIASGLKNREIAGQLGISARTVDSHRSNLLKKLGFRNNADLTRVAIYFDLVPSWSTLEPSKTLCASYGEV